MVQKNVALAAAAAFIIGISSVSAAPMAVRNNELYGRAFEEELYARADKIIKAAAQLAKHVAKDQAHSTLVDAATDKAKSATENKQPISPVAAAAVKQMTKPFNPAAVNAVVFPPKKGQSSGQKKTRDLSGLYDKDLFTRDFEQELSARADKIIKAAAQLAKHVAKDQAHSTLVDAATDKAKSATENKQPISPVAAAAVKQMTGPFNAAAVNAAISKKAPQKKTRSFEEFLEARWFGLEDLD